MNLKCPKSGCGRPCLFTFYRKKEGKILISCACDHGEGENYCKRNNIWKYEQLVGKHLEKVQSLIEYYKIERKS